MPAAIGQPAPAFTLPDPQNNPFSSEDLKGQKSLIIFIPFPFSSVCTDELCAIRDDYSQLESLGAKVVAIACDTRHANRVWTELEKFPFPVLSDFWPHGEVAKAYGVFNENVGAAMRYSFILDAEGVVRHIVKSDQLPQARQHEEYAKALAEI